MVSLVKRCLLLLLLFSVHVIADDFYKSLATAAEERTKYDVTYDGSYYVIDYPNGDVPENIGVCTDVVIRSYRKLDIDLQQALHLDIKKQFSEYPSKRIWGLTRPDKNIDHRRVPNLRAFFTRHGEKLPVTEEGADYKPGELVTWTLPGNLPHIGIISNQKSADGKRPLVVHNIGSGPVLEDMLFVYEVTGRYRYKPLSTSKNALFQ
ncbi:DUF1287 domain-containing protein [Endozoicomonas sp. SM1973]|uniref:DUF1287 domain-containing protein n=1 Tax=Spartinivicinus marinus TaxID=2994442 RepID=A0A853I421_9GAMM|nr:DUF1287 domain-containing protein [Spartinivicinus marinus]MCX4026197.1 DUF1287 domain-containing protein [Spartinivicinus marinus]NYZ67389.1 DUF1287 domain-containing protein [Spartinivicinus marinus]